MPRDFGPEDIEVQLRRALKRQDPSAGFAERVIRRAEGPKHSGWGTWAAAAAAVALVAAPVAYEYRKQQQAEEVREQAILALQITVEKLNAMQEKMQDFGGEGEAEKP
jgi:hypothetical protein